MKRFVSTAALALLLASCASAPQPPVQVRILAINDFHGNLKPPAEGLKTPEGVIPAGGAERLATTVQSLRAGHPNHIFVAAGDLVGASPLLSALFNDEPSIESLGMMGLALSSVGNHEFDHGAEELLRKQHGGCKADRDCKPPAQRFAGAQYQYLAASTVDEKTGKTLLPPYAIRKFEGIPVGFIGLTLQGTPGIVSPDGVAGLRFEDEALTINRYAAELRGQGVEAIVVLIHEGGYPSGGPNECPAISGPIVDIVKKLDASVDLVVSGHTHKAYNCRIAGRLVTSGDKYGTLVTAIDLKLDRKTRDVIEARAENVIVDPRRFAPDPAQTALIAGYEQKAGPLAARIVGRISETFDRTENEAGATRMGQLIADAQLEATRGDAVIALTNIGGVRASLVHQGKGNISYGEVFTVQPFYNNLITLTLSGAQLKEVLEQQWLNQPKYRPLQVSQGFSYRWDAARPIGQRVVAMALNGVPIRPDASYRVTTSAFLHAGGDGFPGFRAGRDARTGAMDIDVLVKYLESRPLTEPAKLDRVSRDN